MPPFPCTVRRSAIQLALTDNSGTHPCAQVNRNDDFCRKMRIAVNLGEGRCFGTVIEMQREWKMACQHLFQWNRFPSPSWSRNKLFLGVFDNPRKSQTHPQNLIRRDLLFLQDKRDPFNKTIDHLGGVILLA